MGLLGVEALGFGFMSTFLLLTDANEAFPEAAEKGAVVVDLHGTCMKSNNKPILIIAIITKSEECRGI